MATFIINIPVPSSGDGVAVNVSTLVGEKTVTLSGTFRGQYVLLGSHDGSHFDPILSFDAGGVEGIKQTFSGALQWVRIRSQVMGASGVVVNISGLSIPGDNAFGIFPVLMPGASGPQASSDLGLVNYQGDVNFMAQGGVRGSVVVEGSLDNQEFNPIGAFSAEPASSSLLGAQSFEFSPLATGDRIRYVRLNVKGTILSPFVVTMGGSQTSTGGGGASETLHLAYEAGSSILDQTLNLTDAQGGKVIFDATDTVGFTDMEAMQVLVSGGEGAAFLSSGGMILGPTSIQIGVSGYPATCTDGSLTVTGGSIAMGLGARTTGYDALYGSYNISMGWYAQAAGDESVAIGPSTSAGNEIGSGYYTQMGSLVVGAYSEAWGNACVALGFECGAGGPYLFPPALDAGIAIGCQSNVYADQAIAIGKSADAWWAGSIAIGPGAMVLDAFDSTDSVALGSTSTVIGMYSIAMGLAAVGDLTIGPADYSVSIGFSTHTYSQYAVALGPDAVGAGPDSVAIGHQAVAGQYAYGALLAETGCIAIGSSASAPSGATAGGNYGIAIGSPAFTSGDFNIAIGYYAEAGDFLGITVSTQNVVIGMEATVGYQGLSVSAPYSNNVVVGSNASSYGTATIVIGSGAQVGEQLTSAIPLVGSIAVGYYAEVDGDDGISIGTHSLSGIGIQNTCMGYMAQVQGMGTNNLCLGDSAQIRNDSNYVIVIGSGATATASTSTDYSIVIGTGASTSGFATTVVGTGASASASGWAVALGLGATAMAISAIAIGTDSHAGANETVFDMTFAHIQTFRAVSNEPDVSGLFQLAADSAYNPGVQTTFTSSSVLVGLHDGEMIAITAGGVYDGYWMVSNVTAHTFDITTAFVSSVGGNWATVLDLFQFAQANLGSNSDINKTDLALLIRDANHNISLRPVYLSVPVLGVSTLLVANP